MSDVQQQQQLTVPIHRARSVAGFTLIELMVVVAIVGILAAVAYPSYMDNVRKSNRAAAQAFMMDVAQRQQNQLMNNRTYATALIDLGVVTPDNVDTYYVIGSNLGAVAGPPPEFTLTLTPKTGMQADDGTLCLSNTGRRVRFCDATGEESW